MSKNKNKEEILKLLYVFRAPVVLAPPNEGDEIPPSLKENLLLSRIACVLSGDFDRGLCSEADMVIHLWSASSKYPIPGDYVAIYSFYANKLLGGSLEKVIEVPEKLSPYLEELANTLRRRIFSLQMKAVEKLVKKPDENAGKIIELFESAVNLLTQSWD